MAAQTYLETVNDLLTELNEVNLTTSNFDSARNIQNFVKGAVNRAYYDIVNENPKWSWLSVTCAGLADPLNPNDQIGNVVQDAVVGQRWYWINPDHISADTGVDNDYGAVEWADFTVTTNGVAGESAPYIHDTLEFITLADFTTKYQDSELADESSSNPTRGQPLRVMRSPCGRKFGLSPIPNKAYKIYYYAYKQATKLVNHNDTLQVPNQWQAVLNARARYYIWQFKENTTQATLALDEYKKGLKFMKEGLMSPQPKYMSTDFVTA